MAQKKLPEILEEARAALLGRKAGHRWSDSASEAYSATLEGLKDFSGDTLGKTADSFNETLPYIQRAGYRVLEIEVGLGLSPKLTAHLELVDVLEAEERQSLMAEVEGRKLIKTILTALFRAADARKRLEFRQFHFAMLELELSILPTVTLKFRPNGPDALAPPLAEDSTP